MHVCRRCAWCSTVTTRLTECNTAILEQDGQLSALTARLLDQREETRWQIEAVAAEAEACVIHPIYCAHFKMCVVTCTDSGLIFHRAMVRVAGLAASIEVAA